MLKRRSFLVSVVAVAFLPWLAKSSMATPSSSASLASTMADAESRLLSLFSDLQAPRAVGKRYLALYPAEANRAVLREGIVEPLAIQDREGLRASLARRCTEDFRDGDTVIVDGWVLARTEARACALAALI